MLLLYQRLAEPARLWLLLRLRLLRDLWLTESARCRLGLRLRLSESTHLLRRLRRFSR